MVNPISIALLVLAFSLVLEEKQREIEIHFGPLKIHQIHRHGPGSKSPASRALHTHRQLLAPKAEGNQRL